jgi:solute carrier family 25 (mitochondrial adenine nucleotide translocator), member 4/5/6/31
MLNTMPEEQKHQKRRAITQPRWREAVAGAGAGAISRTMLAPIERIKLLKQLQGSLKDSNIHQLSAIDVARKIFKEEGVLSFWRGNIPNVIRVAGGQALNFTCMDYYKRAAVAPIIEEIFIIPSSSESSAVQQQQMVERRRRIVTSFVSGGLAGATATTLLYPIEFLRTRLAMDMGNDSRTNMTAQHRQYTGMRDVLYSIVKSDGIFGLYQGYGVALVGGVVYRVLHLGGYDACKTEILYQKNRLLQSQNSIPNAELSWGERFLSAQFISLLSGTITYPFDSVRRRMMMQAGVSINDRLYINSIYCARIVWSTEGLRGFYLGLGPNLVRSIGGAIVLVGYDRIRTWLE